MSRQQVQQVQPTQIPSMTAGVPSVIPSSLPSRVPTRIPTTDPSTIPSFYPSTMISTSASSSAPSYAQSSVETSLNSTSSFSSTEFTTRVNANMTSGITKSSQIGTHWDQSVDQIEWLAMFGFALIVVFLCVINGIHKSVKKFSKVDKPHIWRVFTFVYKIFDLLTDILVCYSIYLANGNMFDEYVFASMIFIVLPFVVSMLITMYHAFYK